MQDAGWMMDDVGLMIRMIGWLDERCRMNDG